MSDARRRHPRPEQRPCPPLTHWGIAVIRASYQLPLAGKLVIELLRDLDRGDGAFLAPAAAAAQLGMGQRYFEEVRAGLVRLGLVVRVEVEGSRCDFWFPRLPDGFPAEPSAETIQATGGRDAQTQARHRWVRQWADELDHIIERGKSAVKWHRPERGKSALSPPTERGKSAHYSAENTRSPGPLSAYLAHPERGKSAPIEHKLEAPTSRSVTLISSTTESATPPRSTTECDTERARSKESATAQQKRDPEETRRLWRESVPKKKPVEKK